ncbi:MAG: 50S ribosomal protein L10 [Chloroflexota bacterium]
MAISKEKKREMVEEYGQWIEQSKAMVMTEYIGLTMKELSDLREKVREAGGEFHVLKNTLAQLAFEKANIQVPEGMFVGSTAIGFAFHDPSALVKAIVDYAKDAELVKIKYGYLNGVVISSEQVKDLASLPPLPVMRARLLAMLMAPANQFARTLVEPSRRVAAILKAYAGKAEAQVAA